MTVREKHNGSGKFYGIFIFFKTDHPCMDFECQMIGDQTLAHREDGETGGKVLEGKSHVNKFYSSHTRFITNTKKDEES
jgi:hypothetical protein